MSIKRFLGLAALLAALSPVQAADCNSADLAMTDPSLHQFGSSFIIAAKGGCLDAIEAQRGKSAGDVDKAVTLYLDAVAMKGLTVTALRRAPGQLDLAVQLQRNPQASDNRTSWDQLLARQRQGFKMALPVALAIGSEPAVVVDGGSKLVFTAVRGGEEMVVGVIAAGLLALVGAFAVLIRGNALRDGWGAAYSLGKSQMAFWGLLVFLTFLGIWILTGTMERIPPQTLTLLGISGVTGLAAVFIGGGKDSVAEASGKLAAEKADLVARQAAGSATARDRQRIAEIDDTLKALAAHAAQPHRGVGDFFRDICDDGTGMSFHRVQVLIWTLLLGAVFVWTVTEVISMPEFPETLLLLMGISNGTYLGFKIPEKT